MGLSGRKVKQRIGNDPRNLSWADDAARFGINYLAKFGWDSSKGLGTSGEGMKSHLKVSHKLDMLGIGAAHQLGPNGIAWKQNKDFESLLERLNGNAVQDSVVEGFKKAENGEIDGVEEKESDLKDEGKRKRKHDGEEEPKKKKKKAAKEDEVKTSSEQRRTVPTLPRHRAHRARAIAAKNLSSKSASHIAEILGIAPTSPSLTTTTTSSGSTSGIDTPQNVEPTSSALEITTSSKSVHDYFKEKLKTKKSSTFGNSSASKLADCASDTSQYDIPRGGLGSSSRMTFGSPTLPAYNQLPNSPAEDGPPANLANKTKKGGKRKKEKDTRD